MKESFIELKKKSKKKRINNSFYLLGTHIPPRNEQLRFTTILTQNVMSSIH